MEKTGGLRSLPPDKLFSRHRHFGFTNEESLQKSHLTVFSVHTKLPRPWAEKAISNFHHAVYVSTAVFYTCCSGRGLQEGLRSAVRRAPENGCPGALWYSLFSLHTRVLDKKEPLLHPSCEIRLDLKVSITSSGKTSLPTPTTG